ncbi:hypothetical protein JYT28_00450 [Desulfobulbus sp. AH-315-M07]|nr:hypothetical protein [Desulfobulbus sp. AH-315-M07]
MDSVARIEVEGRLPAARIRESFFAAARAILADPVLDFAAVREARDEHWKAEGASYSYVAEQVYPGDAREPPSIQVRVELRAGGHTLKVEGWSMVPDKLTGTGVELSGMVVELGWPGLATFDAVRMALCEALRSVSGFVDRSGTLPACCRNAEAALDAGDAAGAKALLSRCDVAEAPTQGKSEVFFRSHYYRQRERIAPLSPEEEAERVAHDPHNTGAWRRIAEAGGAGCWHAAEAEWIAAMQRPWDPGVHGAMPPGGSALALLAFAHPDWMWDRPDDCPDTRWWRLGATAAAWESFVPPEVSRVLYDVLDAIGFPDDVRGSWRGTDLRRYWHYGVGPNGEVAPMASVDAGGWLAGVCARPAVSRWPDPPELWQKVVLQIGTHAERLVWIWFQAGEPGRGACVHWKGRLGKPEIALAGSAAWRERALQRIEARTR